MSEMPAEIQTLETPFGKIEDPWVPKVTYRLASALKRDEMLVVGPLSGPLETSQDPLWLLVSCRVVEADPADPDKVAPTPGKK